jgi:hypothetical protein
MDVDDAGNGPVGEGDREHAARRRQAATHQNGNGGPEDRRQ